MDGDTWKKKNRGGYENFNFLERGPQYWIGSGNEVGWVSIILHSKKAEEIWEPGYLDSNGKEQHFVLTSLVGRPRNSERISKYVDDLFHSLSLT